MGTGERADQRDQTRISTQGLQAQEKSQSVLMRDGCLDFRGIEKVDKRLEVKRPQDEEEEAPGVADQRPCWGGSPALRRRGMGADEWTQGGEAEGLVLMSGARPDECTQGGGRGPKRDSQE